MFCTVILDLVTVGLYFDLILGITVLDCQCSVSRCNGVVVRLGSVIQCVCECVLTVSDKGLASCHIVGCAFAGGKAVAANCHCSVSKCCAVVFLLISPRCQSNCSLVDDKLSFRLMYGELVCDIISGCILYDCSACDSVGVRTGICSAYGGCQTFNRKVLSVLGERERLEAFGCLPAAVIGVCAAVGLYCDLILCSPVCYGQCARNHGDRVVVSLCAFTQRICECIGT